MSSSAPEPTLYGLGLSNRRGPDLWGKNQFNGCFPVALACWMRDQSVPLLLVQATKTDGTTIAETPAGTVLGTQGAIRPYFAFETSFGPYARLLYDPEHIERADVIVGAASESGSGIGTQYRPFEIKLTTVPDNTTATHPESEWAPELVVRQSTTMHCALGLFVACGAARSEILDIVEPVCKDVSDWGHEHEMLRILRRVVDTMGRLQEVLEPFQTPVLLQAIWKTKGKTQFLADQAFDLFAWSDLALLRILADRVSSKSNQSTISRHARALLRVWRILFELTRNEKVHLRNTFTQMTYRHQSDKEFALSGRASYAYMRHPRLFVPRISKHQLRHIILHGGQDLLSPERRLDQSIYFSAPEIFDSHSEHRE